MKINVSDNNVPAVGESVSARVEGTMASVTITGSGLGAHMVHFWTMTYYSVGT